MSVGLRERCSPAAWQRKLEVHLRQMSGSPGRVARGFALGVAVACTPLIGFHFILAVGAAIAARASVPAAVLGSFAANPWTYPLTLGAGYAIGSRLIGLEIATAGTSRDTSGLLALAGAVGTGDWAALAGLGPVIGTMLLGGIVLGMAAGALAYMAAWATLRRMGS